MASSTPEDIDEFLAHFGVKGMHWGSRKAAAPMHAKYSVRNQVKDQHDFGNGGVKRINQRIHDGKTHKQARRREIGRRTLISAAVTGAFLAAPILEAHGSNLASKIAVKAQTNRGRAAAAASMGIPTKVSSLKYAKAGKSGAFKVSSL